MLFSQRAFAQSPLAWTFTGPLGTSDRIVALAVDPRNESVIYAAAPGGGVWKTQDGGLVWVPLFDSVSSLQVCSLAIDPHFPDVIYAGTGDNQSPRPAQGVARTNDGGRTWTLQPRFTNQPVCTLAIDPTNPARIFAGSAEGLFISSDSGASWTKTLTSPVTSVALDSPGTIYAGILGPDSPGKREQIVARSSDNGRTWTNLILPANPNALTAQTTGVTVLANGGTIFAAVSYSILPVVPGTAASAQTPLSLVDSYSSTDAGNSWFATFGIGQARPPAALFADPTGTLFFAGANLLISGNRGLTWETITTKTREFHTAVTTAGTFLLGGEKGLESVLRGGFARVISQLPVSQILGVSIDPPNGIWAAGPAGLFSLSTSSLTNTSVLGVGSAGSVAVVAAGSSTTIFAAGNDRVYDSENGASLFSSSSVIAIGEMRALSPPLVVDPVITSSAYVAGRRLYHTTNSGSSWTALSIVDPDPTTVVIALAMAPSARSNLYAATACIPEVESIACPATSVIWRSTNSGQTWVQMSVVAGFVNRFAIDPRQSTRVYAAIGAFPAGPSVVAGLVSGDLLLSTNAGGAWTSLKGNLPATPVNTVRIDTGSLPVQFNQPAQTVYVGTDAGVFVSFNAGLQWTDISAGLPASPITDLAIAQPDGILAAATFGRGVYRTSIIGLAPSIIVNPLSDDVTLMQGTTINDGIALINQSTTTTFAWQLNALDSWISVPQPNGSLRPLGSFQVPIVVSAVGLQTGIHIGRLQLFSTSGVQNILVVAHVTASPAQMTISSGDNASGLPGDELPPLQVFLTDANQLPLPGVSVTFAITAGEGSLSARTVTTNAAGIASTILTLPAKPGNVQVRAASGPLSVTFNATAITAPILMTDSIFDGVTFNANASLGPGSIVAIFGQNLASAEAVAGSGPLPVSLQNTRVVITGANGDIEIPLFSVSPLQIRALIPLDTAPGTYKIRSELASVRSNDIEISIAAFAPGIFAVNGSGRGAGIFIKDDGSVVTAANPADRGSRVTFYAAGLGAVNPPVAAGQPGAASEPLNRTVLAPRVGFDRYSAIVTYSGLAPGIAGRYQVTVQVPALLSPATNISVSLTIGGFTSNRVTIPVR